MITRSSWLVYGTLAAIWIGLIAWQTAEHERVNDSLRAALRDRAREFSTALGVVMRSQRRFPGGVLSRERLESALNGLMLPGGIKSVELFNVEEGTVAVAGAPIDLPIRGRRPGNEFWGDQTVIFENLVDLGTNNIVVSRNDFTNRPPTVHPGTNAPATDGTNAPSISALTNSFTGAEPHRPFSTNGPPDEPPFRREGGPRGWHGSEEEFEQYRAFLQKRGGVHSFIIAMSTQDFRKQSRDDLWLRLIIGVLGTISVAGFGYAWRNTGRNYELQIRLTRASELNSHLKEMNLAAAGLAHETRNPLNIIRGLAQMISKQQEASPEVRTKSRDIINEADRVAAQLNEFINYSRPRELRRVPTSLNAVVAEVVRALNYDIEEKKVKVEAAVERLTVEADEQLLRQVLFNLVLNAIQAVSENGEIYIRSGRRNGSGAFVEIADNGPGVLPEHRNEIFKPYFTTHQKGTGLGLAVVQQVVSAHGWEIQCLPNQPHGALFRIDGLKVIVKH